MSSDTPIDLPAPFPVESIENTIETVKNGLADKPLSENEASELQLAIYQRKWGLAARVGFDTGVSLFIVFGPATVFASFALWRTFLGLNSAHFPMPSFGDAFLRIQGPTAGYAINVAPTLDQFMGVAIMLPTNGQLISQLA